MITNHISAIEAYLTALANGEQCTITHTQELSEEGAFLCQFTWDNDTEESACIVYTDGELVVFTRYDWQSVYPTSEEEIADFDWVCGERTAIILNGLPRLLA
mgnify:CR=1 FL=1